MDFVDTTERIILVGSVVISHAIAVCSIIDAKCPQPKAGSRWVGVRKLVSFIAVNFGHAANAVPAGLPANVHDFISDAAAVTAAAPAIAAVGENAARLANDFKEPSK